MSRATEKVTKAIRFSTHSHYGFAPEFCHANDPQSKGVVENLVGYAQRDLAVLLLIEESCRPRHRRCPCRQRDREYLVRGSQQAGAFGNRRHPRSTARLGARAVVALPSLRLEIGPRR